MSSGRVDFAASYDVQEVCLNGHVTNNHASDEARNQNFCDHCGAKTITACPHCKGPIRGGHKYNPSSPIPGPPEAYCLHWGRPFPWTQASVDSLRAIAAVGDGLNEEDRAQLVEILPDLIAKTKTPRTQLAIVQMKKLLKKGGTVFSEAVRKTIVDVASETIKKTLFP
jgi:hypothetical protein